MTNAKYDKDGLHITLDGEKTIDVKTEELNNFVNHKNYVTLEEEHFLPVWNSETKESSIFTFDKESKVWSLSETLEPLELSTDLNNIGACTYKDVISGHLVESLKTLEITFPENAINAGWENSEGSNLSNLVLTNRSKGVMQLASICEINDDFLGLPDRQSYVASVAVLNADNSIGYINFLLDHKKALDWFLNKLETSSGTGIEIRKQHSEKNVSAGWNGEYAPTFRLYKTQGEKKIMTVITILQISGKVPEEMKELLITPN